LISEYGVVERFPKSFYGLFTYFVRISVPNTLI